MNPVPLRTLLGGEVIPPAWAQWFQQVVTSLGGWSTSITTTATIDFGSIGAGSELSSAVTVTGVRAGSSVTVTPSANIAGLFFVGIATADNTVTIYAKNFTAGAINPASTTFRIIVLQN